MDLYKIEHFNQESDGIPFPWFYALDEEEQRHLRREFGERLSSENRNPTDMELCRLLRPHWKLISEVNANDPDFKIADLLSAKGVRILLTVYLDWAEDEDRFGASIDEMKFADLAEAFPLIWYPELDDLLIFDDSCNWACWISLNGSVNIANLSKGTI